MSKRVMNDKVDSVKRKKVGSTKDRQEEVEEEVFGKHAVKDEQETMKSEKVEEDQSCGEKVDEKKSTKKRVTWAQQLVKEYSDDDEQKLESDSEDDMEKEDSEDDKDEVDSGDDKEEKFEEGVVQKKGHKKPKTAVTKKDSKKAPKKATKKAMEDEPLYLIEALVGHKKRNGQIVFFVKWLNYPESDNTWEPLESFETSRHFVYNYLDKEGLESWVPDVAKFYSKN